MIPVGLGADGGGRRESGTARGGAPATLAGASALADGSTGGGDSRNRRFATGAARGGSLATLAGACLVERCTGGGSSEGDVEDTLRGGESARKIVGLGDQEGVPATKEVGVEKKDSRSDTASFSPGNPAARNAASRQVTRGKRRMC